MAAGSWLAGRYGADQRLSRLPGRPGILAAAGACLCFRPVGVRPVAGRRAARPGRGVRRCGAALPGVLPAGAAAGSRAATCTRSGTAATSAMRLRRSAGGWPRCRACSAAGRCGTRLRPAPSRVAPRHAGQRPGSAGPPGPAKRRSGLRVREPRRLPRGLGRAETTALLASFRTD
jgi:hypothetical protein